MISCNKLDKNSVDMIPPSSPSSKLDKNGGFAPSPITPDSNKETADLMSAFTSPLTILSSPLTTHHSGDDCYMNLEDDDESPGTPKEGVFDPFAPGPDKLMNAPLSLKQLEESRSYVARRLNFNNSNFTKKDCEKRESGFEDEVLLEAVYDSLLEAIISKQAEDILAEMTAVGLSCDGLETPPSAPRVSGIADTCPGAPMKPIRKSRNIDLSLCRRLDFDF
ncbi:hypothetical protein LXL04_000107 [Taraxacum kok-saghyz]